ALVDGKRGFIEKHCGALVERDILQRDHGETAGPKKARIIGQLEMPLHIRNNPRRIHKPRRNAMESGISFLETYIIPWSIKIGLALLILFVGNLLARMVTRVLVRVMER